MHIKTDEKENREEVTEEVKIAWFSVVKKKSKVVKSVLKRHKKITVGFVCEEIVQAFNDRIVSSSLFSSLRHKNLHKYLCKNNPETMMMYLNKQTNIQTFA